ncbi:MAG: peptidyl-tRNA hydrolase Pth2 [Candidatus Micrarchaeota archaeon]|nr:peptidyl-tRNA hydrolase Pth2 [Candidatus Micrarchaeota archaeon]
MLKEEIKQVIIVRTDIEMSRGKTAAQVAHASLMSYFEAEKSDRGVAKEWLDTGEKKIVLKVSDEESLSKLYKAFEYKKIPCALVSDAGLTQLPPGTKTALGIGPWKASDIDQFTRGFKLL